MNNSDVKNSLPLLCFFILIQDFSIIGRLGYVIQDPSKTLPVAGSEICFRKYLSTVQTSRILRRFVKLAKSFLASNVDTVILGFYGSPEDREELFFLILLSNMLENTKEYLGNVSLFKEDNKTF